MYTHFIIVFKLKLIQHDKRNVTWFEIIFLYNIHRYIVMIFMCML